MSVPASPIVAPGNGTAAEPRLAAASRRLRRRAGRRRTLSAPPPGGVGIQGAALGAAEDAAESRVFATSLPSQHGWGRGLPLRVASSYSGVPVRGLWRLIVAGALPVVRVPGMRAILVLRDDLDVLLVTHRGAHASAGERGAEGVQKARAKRLRAGIGAPSACDPGAVGSACRADTVAVGGRS